MGENCDSKTSIILSFFGIAITIILASDFTTRTLNIIKFMLTANNFLSILYLILMISSMVCVAVGIFFLIYVLLPKTNNKKYSESGLPADSLIFFRTIAENKSFHEYNKRLHECSVDDLKMDINAQVFINSKVCKSKFDNYTTGLKFSVIGTASFVILVIIGLIVK